MIVWLSVAASTILLDHWTPYAKPARSLREACVKLVCSLHSCWWVGGLVGGGSRDIKAGVTI